MSIYLSHSLVCLRCLSVRCACACVHTVCMIYTIIVFVIFSFSRSSSHFLFTFRFLFSVSLSLFLHVCAQVFIYLISYCSPALLPFPITPHHHPTEKRFLCGHNVSFHADSKRISGIQIYRCAAMCPYF